jgi:hypothetical protein
MMSSRCVHGIAVILGLTAAFACWCRAPLIWDGAYQFDMTLALQHPYVYLTRFHTWFLWWPTVWASHFTSNIMILQTLYGLPFLLAPMASVLLSWWMVKDHAPHLIIWAVFGVAAATLPGQIFVINDSIFQQHLFWPVLLGMMVPVTDDRRIVRAGLIVFQLAHPIGVPLLFGGMVAVALVAIADRTHRRMLLSNALMLGTVCALAVVKIVVSNSIERFHDTYAAHQATWEVVVGEWRRGVLGAPIQGLVWIWVGGGLLLAQRELRRRGGSAVAGAAIALGAVCCVVTGATRWIGWANDPTGQAWMGAIDYRRWIGPLTLPFFLLATIEMFMTASGTGGPPVISTRRHGRAAHATTIRGFVGIMLAATFALVLGLQSATWSRLTDRLMYQVNHYDASAVVPYSAREVAWFRYTPLGHWGTGNYVSAMQGKTPARIFLDPLSEEEFRGSSPRLEYYAASPEAPPGPGGWFDFRGVLQQVRAESRAGVNPRGTKGPNY